MSKKNKRVLRLKAWLMRWLCNRAKVKFSPTQINSILVLRYDRIGDMVVTTPLFRALKKGFPGAELSVLASQANATVIKNNPNVDQIYVFSKSITSRLMLLMKLRRKRFSLLIDLEHNLIWHQIIHTRLINPKWVASSFKCDRYGVNTHTLTLYDVMAKVKPDNPMVEIYLGISEALGVPRVEGDERYQLVLSKENLAYAESYFNSESFFVGFNFFGSKKGWEISAEDFYKLCSEVFAIRPTLKVLVFATQENLPRIKDMVAAATLPFVRVVSPTSDVMDAAAIISKLDLVITPDTSFTHIVCAFDIPIVSINPKGDEVFQNWKPIHPSSRARVIFSKGAKSLKGYSYEELKSAVESYLPPISV